MADSPAGHKPKMKSGDKSRFPSLRPPDPDTTSVSVGKLDLSGRGEIMAFEVRTLVWDQLEQKLNIVEWEEAKSILGENIIDDNKSLKEENLALLSIWKDFTHATNSVEEQCQYQHQIILLPRPLSFISLHSLSFELRRDINKAAKSPLPEPPHVRDLLFKQIKFFIDELPTRSKREIVATTTPREKAVYDYVTSGSLPSRPSTAGASRDKPTDVRPNSARSSGTPTPTVSPEGPHDLRSGDVITGNTDAALHLLRTQERLDLDVLQDNVIQLKALLIQEHDLLLKDAEFLQFCLEQQADYNSQLHKYTKEKQDSVVPTLQEMKEFNSKLEQKYLETSHGCDKEKERKPPSSARPRTSSLPDASTTKPMRHSLSSSSATPSPPRSRSSLTASITPMPKSPSETSGGQRSTEMRNSESINHIPHPPKEQRPDTQRPHAKLTNVNPSTPSPLPSVSPTSSLPTLSSMNASPKRTRLKQT